MQKAFTHSISIAILFFTSFLTFAQYSTKGFGFQGYAVGADGKAIASTGITVKFSLSPNIGSGITYTEEQVLTSDIYGVFTATVGTGTNKTGGPFEVLNFTSVYYKLKVEVKKTTGGSYTTISDQALNAVPYARAAENGVPVGSIMPFAGPVSAIPAGWIQCNGQTLDGTSAMYLQLYNVISTTWGGTGQNSFQVPDLRGVFLRGINDGRSDTYADPSTRAIGSMQDDAYATHNHGVTDLGHTHGYRDRYFREAQNAPTGTGYERFSGDNNAGSGNGDGDNWTWYVDGSTNNSTTGLTVNNSANGNVAETRPANAAVYYIIKY
ncbi:tail fiber protein [uncultured Cytophaga sp.]|uniref:tail fiber protein n=1 Tax=uncultured Cytophaga sp. TaxID=160238 RepID=UPI00262B94CC|nr:tail fiber protein [uncultured Cytophaga sp.]